MNRRQLMTYATLVVGSGLSANLFQTIEHVRREADDAMSVLTVGEHNIDRLEQRTVDYGYAYRTRPALPLLRELTLDFIETRQLISRAQAPDQQRRLYATISQLAGLIALAFKNLGRFADARRWFATAQLAAAETGDRQLRAWVVAKESILAIDSDMPPEAVIARAQFAQSIAGSTASAGKLIAVTVEARALGQQGRYAQVEAKRREAEAIFDRLGGGSVNSSAFAMSEQQMHFYLGNALRLSGQGRLAESHWEHALSLYPANEIQDPTLIRLDRAAGLVRSGAIDAGCDYAVNVLTSLPKESKVSLVLNWAKGVTDSVPVQLRAQSSVQNLRELVAASTHESDARG
jgi:tetratricopeptide (TPR) repeat protein